MDAAPAHRGDEEGDSLKFNYTLPFSRAGWPCAVVRAGASPDGLPIGVQIVGGPWQEHVAVAAAQRIEESLGGWSGLLKSQQICLTCHPERVCHATNTASTPQRRVSATRVEMLRRPSA